MSLTVYDPIKGCFVLAPEKPPIINAFHPDYVKTYHPDLLTSIKADATQKAKNDKPKATRESVNKKAFTINKFPKTKARVDLAPKEFHVFNKAGMPKGNKP